MELEFLFLDGWWVSEFSATSDFNLHIEKDKGDIYLYQRTSGQEFDFIQDFGFKKGGDNVIDVDFTALVYPKQIKIKSKVKPTVAELTLGSFVGGGGSAGGDTGGDSDSGELRRNDVNFFDYDGTLLYSYSWDEAKELAELPALPVHDGLEARKWNYTLEDIKEQGKAGFMVDDDDAVYFYAGEVAIGGITYNAYNDSGEIRLTQWDDGDDWAYLTLSEPRVGDTIISAYINWDTEEWEFDIKSDGSLYEYVISYTTETKGKVDVGACCYDDYGDQVLGDGVYIVERGLTSVPKYSRALIGVFSIPVTIDWISQDSFISVLFTTEVKIPASVHVANSGYNAFYSSLAPSVYWNGGNKEYVDGIGPLPVVDIPENVRVVHYLPQNCIAKFPNINEIWYGDNNYSETTLLDFTNVDYVPYFNNFFSIDTYSLYVIVVPDSLYEEWINTTNWSDVADYIYPLSAFPWMNNK